MVEAPLDENQSGVRTLCHAADKIYLALAATLAVGLSWRWLAEQVFEDRSHDATAHMMQLAAHAPPGASGILFLPYLAGERTPIMDARAAGAFVGLRVGHTCAHLARAVLEGVALCLRHALSALQEVGVHVHEILLAGGPAHQPIVCRVVADVLAREATPLVVRDQSAIGASLLAAVATGGFATMHEACTSTIRTGTAIQPDPTRSTLYDQLYVTYCDLYPALREHLHALSDGYTLETEGYQSAGIGSET